MNQNYTVTYGHKSADIEYRGVKLHIKQLSDDKLLTDSKAASWAWFEFRNDVIRSFCNYIDGVTLCVTQKLKRRYHKV
jgi:hypothetical protein